MINKLLKKNQLNVTMARVSELKKWIINNDKMLSKLKKYKNNKGTYHK